MSAPPLAAPRCDRIVSLDLGDRGESGRLLLERPGELDRHLATLLDELLGD